MTEHFDVIVIGAGLSGIGAAYHLQTECPNKTYAVLESREAIGGTWDLFRYPGIRSDSDMYTLGYRFKPWEDQKAIADGPSILEYVRETARENGIDSHIRFRHRVWRASWSSETATWTVEVERTDNGETLRLGCNFLFGCTGYYDYEGGYTPDFPGVARFGGTVDPPAEVAGRLRLRRQARGGDRERRHGGHAGPGAGREGRPRGHAPALADLHRLAAGRGRRRQLAPREAPRQARLRHLPLEERAPLDGVLRAGCGKRPSSPRSASWSWCGTQLGDGYDVETHFNPCYDPWDQRLCLVPDGDLFEAIQDGRASVVTDRIETFTEKGLRLDSGEELEADLVVTATGLM